ncbi:MAG TPA: hypothetical protein DCP47_01455 [Phycisphaerales bacterium]|nr:hypothetical protein [Phycisphaerales bacterium]
MKNEKSFWEVRAVSDAGSCYRDVEYRPCGCLYRGGSWDEANYYICKKCILKKALSSGLRGKK